jgi:hypothetical protein
MILVIAVNQNHYTHWCREVGLNPSDRSSVRYISEPDQLRGLIGRKDIEILTLPSWYVSKSAKTVDAFDLLITEHGNRRVLEFKKVENESI